MLHLKRPLGGTGLAVRKFIPGFWAGLDARANCQFTPSSMPVNSSILMLPGMTGFLHSLRSNYFTQEARSRLGN